LAQVSKQHFKQLSRICQAESDSGCALISVEDSATEH